MLTVACVEHGDYLKRGRQYVENLRSMVSRNLDRAHDFVCLTDDPTRHPGIKCQWLPSREKDGLTGWWAKLYLFSPGRFQGRVLYLDLDCVITGSLDELSKCKGIIHLKEWGWTKNCYGSGVMAWDGGEHPEIWDKYTSEAPHTFEGDQNYIQHVSEWPALPVPPTLCSYRYHAKKTPPKGSVVCSMHGSPKPHEITDGWVPDFWR